MTSRDFEKVRSMIHPNWALDLSLKQSGMDRHPAAGNTHVTFITNRIFEAIVPSTMICLFAANTWLRL